jgi:ParB family chromosome partitioning protein
LTEVPIESIVPDPNQPRKNFDENKLKELAESIKQSGQLNPILVRPIGDKYQIVHGERRYRACQLLGLKTIRAEVRKLDDNQVLEIQLVENLQREDLNPIEEAETYQRMIDDLGYTHEEIGKKIGKSREYVTNKLRLLKMTGEMIEAIRSGKITESHARLLMPLEQGEQKEILNEIVDRDLNVKDTQHLISGNVSHETSDIPEDGLVIGIWLSNDTHQVLAESAESRKTTVEHLCQTIIEEAAKNC